MFIEGRLNAGCAGIKSWMRLHSKKLRGCIPHPSFSGAVHPGFISAEKTFGRRAGDCVVPERRPRFTAEILPDAYPP